MRDGAATIHKILGRDEPEMLYYSLSWLRLAGSSVFLILSWFSMFQIVNFLILEDSFSSYKFGSKCRRLFWLFCSAINHVYNF